MLSKTVWSNADRTRHFLIPDDAELPPGDFVLCTVTGRQMEVQEDAALPYEVTREEAKEHLKGQLDEVIGEAKTRLTGFAEHLRARSAEMRAERREAVADFKRQARAAAEKTSSGEPGEHPDPEIGSALQDLHQIVADLGKALRSIGEVPADPLAQADRLEELAGEIEQVAAAAGTHLRNRAHRLREHMDQGHQQDQS